MDDTEDESMCIEATCDRTGEDRISKLPDPLLCDILSYLSTGDVVRTSILSTRWRSLWKWVPALVLDSDEFPDYGTFTSFVDGFLGLQIESYLHTFNLSLYDGEFDASRFKSWINAVVKRKIQHLTVQNCIQEFTDELHIEMPLNFCTCENLVRLELSYVALDTPEIVSLPSVKIMRLEFVKYANDLTLEMLISNCTVLEDLSLRCCPEDVLEVYCVRSQCLRRFSLEMDLYTDYDYDDYEIMVDAPGLKYLRLKNLIIGSVDLATGSLDKVDLSVMSDLGYGDGPDGIVLSERERIRSLFTRISSVSSLIISVDTVQVVQRYSETEPLPRFYYLCHMDAGIDETLVEMLPTLLESCPNLKSLVLWVTSSWQCTNSRGRKQCRFASVPSCLLSTLEEVTVYGAANVVTNAVGIEIVRYLLENSAVLKKLFLRRDHYSKMIENSAALEELLTVPSRYEVVVEDEYRF